MTLQDQIDTRRREIHTDGYSMSIGEVMSMYRDGDLEIHPEFQRIFRWTDEQKSRLVESILLGIPIPTVFVSQRDDGVWDVIDGVQRLSTILEFVGLYRDEEGRLQPPLTLMATEYLPDLAGFRYEADDEENPKSGSTGKAVIFDEVLQRDFKRSKLDFVIVKKESDPDSKFDLFQRLNSGTELSAQEARNCLLVMIDRTFYEWVVQCSVSEPFQTIVPISQRKEDEGFRQELVLRFFLQDQFAGNETELGRELGEFLTAWVREVAMSASFDRVSQLARFQRVFAMLKPATGEDSFRRWDIEKKRFLGPFSISAFEVITSGLAAHLDYWEGEPPAALLARIQAVWTDQHFRDNSGTGISPRRRMPRLVAYGRRHFAPA